MGKGKNGRVSKLYRHQQIIAFLDGREATAVEVAEHIGISREGASMLCRELRKSGQLASRGQPVKGGGIKMIWSIKPGDVAQRAGTSYIDSIKNKEWVQ